MNRLCISVFLMGMMVVVLGKTLEEHLKVLRTIDTETVLNNDRIMKNYIDCVLGEKVCTKEGNALKDSWKDGLDRGCEGCSPEEEKTVKKIVKHLYVKRPEWYKLLTEKLDPEAKYQKKYDDYIKDVLKDTTL